MSKILVIGNSGLKKDINDGQTIKTRIYLKKIRDEGQHVEFIDLEGFKTHFYHILRKIKKGIKSCDRIVLLTAERGSKFLIPFINKYNKKYHKVFILPLIGIGILHYSIDHLSNDEKKEFFKGIFPLKKRKENKFSNQLNKINFILAETELIANIYKEFYCLNNVDVLNNFRETVLNVKKQREPSEFLRTVFISRVWKEKGIFDLIEIVKSMDKEDKRIKLDIYGPINLSPSELKDFNSEVQKSKNIKYYGMIRENQVLETLSNYDLLVFPTRYFGEGTPGIISESLMAGVPILTSNFVQASLLLKDGYDSIFFEMFNKDDLKNKLFLVLKNKHLIDNLSSNAIKSGKKFTYEYNRLLFLKYICGIEKRD